MMKEEVEGPSHPRMTVENQLQGGSTVFEKLRFLELGCHEIDEKNSSLDRRGGQKMPEFDRVAGDKPRRF
jgi:hypothetical protein